MKQIITTERKPIKLWLDDIEEGALEQAKNLANLPCTYLWVAIMPDSHQGYGMPIGGVLATTDVVIPNAVGVDIGCGVSVVRTSLKEIDIKAIKNIMSAIRKKVPRGFAHHKEKQHWKGFDRAPKIPVITEELEAARYQLGTLGGGNHFMEIQKGSDGYIWLMLHSGSRNFGYKIANSFHQKALRLIKEKRIDLPDKDLAYLPLQSREAKEYLDAMNFALDFARENRRKMMKAMKESVAEVIGEEDVTFDEMVDIHHNYAAQETHFDREVIVHRKGATAAKYGQIGIIPGSQGTKSYIVKGKGNPESFMSCSHGAGRKIGRKEAQRTLCLKHETQFLDDQGVIHTLRHQRDLDEAAGAYKDINEVMKNQEDLVEILVELTPLAVIKA